MRATWATLHAERKRETVRCAYISAVCGRAHAIGMHHIVVLFYIILKKRCSLMYVPSVKIWGADEWMDEWAGGAASGILIPFLPYVHVPTIGMALKTA